MENFQCDLSPEQFAKKLTNVLDNAGLSMAIGVGSTVGLFSVLADLNQPETVDVIAKKAGLVERFVWCWFITFNQSIFIRKGSMGYRGWWWVGVILLFTCYIVWGHLIKGLGLGTLDYNPLPSPSGEGMLAKSLIRMFFVISANLGDIFRKKSFVNLAKHLSLKF